MFCCFIVVMSIDGTGRARTTGIHLMSIYEYIWSRKGSDRCSIGIVYKLFELYQVLFFLDVLDGAGRARTTCVHYL